MKPPKRTLPSILKEVSPIAPAAPAAPVKSAAPGRGPQHSFFIDEDLDQGWRLLAVKWGINEKTGKRYTKQDIFNQAIRQLLVQHPETGVNK